MYKELAQATEMFLSKTTACSPVFQMLCPMEGCVSSLSGLQTLFFFTSSCCRLLRCFHSDLLLAVSLIACYLQHPLNVKIQRPTAKHYTMTREYCGSVVGKVVRYRGVRKPQEDLQSQVIWAHGSTHRLNHQPKTMHGIDLDLLTISSRCAPWSLCGLFNNCCGAVSNLDSVTCLWISFPLLGCLVWPQWESIH